MRWVQEGEERGEERGWTRLERRWVTVTEQKGCGEAELSCKWGGVGERE